MQQTANDVIISSLFTGPVSQVSSYLLRHLSICTGNWIAVCVCACLCCRSSWEARLAVPRLDFWATCWATPRVQGPLVLCMASCTKARLPHSFHSEHLPPTTSAAICNLQQVSMWNWMHQDLDLYWNGFEYSNSCIWKFSWIKCTWWVTACQQNPLLTCLCASQVEIWESWSIFFFNLQWYSWMSIQSFCFFSFFAKNSI